MLDVDSQMGPVQPERQAHPPRAVGRKRGDENPDGGSSAIRGRDFNALLQIQSASEAVVPKLAGTLSEGGALLARQIHFLERPSAPVEMAIHLSTMAWNASSS
jgi:hypothetical protein